MTQNIKLSDAKMLLILNGKYSQTAEWKYLSTQTNEQEKKNPHFWLRSIMSYERFKENQISFWRNSMKRRPQRKMMHNCRLNLSHWVLRGFRQVIIQNSFVCVCVCVLLYFTNLNNLFLIALSRNAWCYGNPDYRK